MIWAFIFVNDRPCPEVFHTVLEHDGGTLLVYGVNTVEEGGILSKKLMEEENCKLIELCGGFGADGARQVIKAVGGAITVGHIEYLPETQEALDRLREEAAGQ